MGIFKKLLGTAQDAVQLPIDVFKDKWTLGGTLTGRDEAYTLSRVKKLAEHADGLVDEVKELVKSKDEPPKPTS